MPIASEQSASRYENLHYKKSEEARLEAADEMPHQRSNPCTSTGEDIEMSAILDQESKVSHLGRG